LFRRQLKWDKIRGWGIATYTMVLVLTPASNIVPVSLLLSQIKAGGVRNEHDGEEAAEETEP
jgi:hypothetical protein